MALVLEWREPITYRLQNLYTCTHLHLPIWMLRVSRVDKRFLCVSSARCEEERNSIGKKQFINAA
jgi:hypothetical protein